MARTLSAHPEDFTNAIYAVVCPVFEAIEHGRRRVGSGHHAAQEVLAAFERYVAERPAIFKLVDEAP